MLSYLCIRDNRLLNKICVITPKELLGNLGKRYPVRIIELLAICTEKAFRNVIFLIFWNWNFLRKGHTANLKTYVTRKRNTKHLLQNKHFLSPDTRTYVCISRGKTYSFYGKYGVICFFASTILRKTLLLSYRRTVILTPFMQKRRK